ncbi:MAG TPA: Hsp20/alpha crystallin family protein [Luteibaculaceae bacterium]|nr:Hsp20/alpha crystallin family protein [Luteibaculaceae bacterium]
MNSSIEAREALSPIDFWFYDFLQPRRPGYRVHKHADNQHAPANIIQTEEQYVIQLIAPGFVKDSFSVVLKDRQLVVSSKLPEPDNGAPVKYNLHEFDIKPIKRTFQLQHENIDTDAIEARYDQGILSIHLPKKTKETEKEKNIAIN